MSGAQVMHPLLILLANIDSAFQSKALNHLFVLLAILPIPKFIKADKKVKGVLEDWLLHECLNLVTLHPASQKSS